MSPELLRFLLIVLPFLTCGCDAVSPDNGDGSGGSRSLQFHAEAAPEWTALFERENGWLAADGIFTIPLSGVERRGDADRTLVYFSDTITGTVNEENRIDGLRFLNNTAAVLQGTEPDPEDIEFFYTRGGNPATLFTPSTPAANTGNWYWLGDGFVNKAAGDTTFIFAYRMKKRTDGGGVFNFISAGVALLAIPPGDEPPFPNHVQRDTPLFLEGEGGARETLFGAGVLVNTEAAGAPDPDGYVYVYGLNENNKGLVVGRVAPGSFTDFDAWEFRAESRWSPNIEDAVEVTDRVSNELSVTPTQDGRFILVFQKDTNSPDVAVRVGHSPVGPWDPMQIIYTCPEAGMDTVVEDATLFCYNAKAHLHLSEPGELLVSYNVNATGGGLAALGVAHLYYRPRFIRVTYN